MENLPRKTNKFMKNISKYLHIITTISLGIATFSTAQNPANALTPRFVSGSSTVVEGFDGVTFNDGTSDITVDITFVDTNNSYNDIYGTGVTPSNPSDLLLLNNTGAFNLASVLLDAMNPGLETLVAGSGDGFLVPGEFSSTNVFAFTDDPFGDVVDTFVVGRSNLFGPTIGNRTPIGAVTFDTVPEPVPFELSPTLGLLMVGGIWGISRLRKSTNLTKIL